jgi:hypothetical protein
VEATGIKRATRAAPIHGHHKQSVPPRKIRPISDDVPYEFRTNLNREAREDLDLSDWLKEVARQPSIREMKNFTEARIEKLRLVGPQSKAMQYKVQNLYNHITRGTDRNIVAVSLRRRAFEIDAQYLDVIRRPYDFNSLPNAQDKISTTELIDFIRESGGNVMDDKVSFKVTRAHVIDALAIVSGARNSSSRPSGLKTSRMAFFIAAHCSALIDEQKRTGRDALLASDEHKVSTVSFRIGSLAIARALAIDLSGWEKNLNLICANQSNLTKNRSLMPAREIGRT